MSDLPEDLEQTLRSCGAISAAESVVSAEQLAGGVSSDIWKIDTNEKTICAKRALSRLKVAQVWEAPTERNRYEARWYRVANEIVAGAAPQVIAADDKLGVFAMDYFNPTDFFLWKAELSQGKTDIESAARVGAVLGQIHQKTAGQDIVAAQFDTAHLIEALRLSPYFRATIDRHPDLTEILTNLADRAQKTKIALVHGDVSPKNILLGNERVVILDAECAWYGDPAFDPAFCLNHLLLKSVWVPEAHSGFQASFKALWSAYLNEVDWESRQKISARTAEYLGALMLARIDGKSPVEYITAETDKSEVRHFAKQWVTAPASDPLEIAAAWNEDRLAHA